MSNSHKEPFSKVLRRVRKNRGWTQSDLAEKLNADTNTIGRWERGLFLPTPFLQHRLCELFGKSLEEFGLLSEETLPILFLSYAYADQLSADQVKRDLENRGFTVWNNEENRFCGEERNDKLRKIFSEVQATVLIASPHAHSTQTVKDELDLAKRYKCPVYVLWIGGKRRKDAQPPLNIVHTIDAIDAREEHYEKAINQLYTALQQQLQASSKSSSTSEPRNPYKGLRAFHREDANDFFGRDQLINDLADQLELFLAPLEQGGNIARFLTLLGSSGSGKSSVVLAGLLPRLQSDEFPGSKDWIYLPIMTPGKHPIKALAATLEQAFPEKTLVSIYDDLNTKHARGLHLLAKWLAPRREGKVVLVVDQFEELFTQTTDEQERKQFISLLVTASTEQDGPVIVLCTLRADFYDKPMSYPELGSIIERHNKSVFPMTMDELEAAIRCPASQVDVQLTYDKQLIEEIILELQGQTGALPLLQFTLEQLFTNRTGHDLTFQAYHELGGVKGALSRHAERTYQHLPSDEHRRLARTLFIRLIDLDATEQKVTSRRTSFSEFNTGNAKQDHVMKEVIDTFIAARLLTISQMREVTAVEISHEALSREWERYSLWLQENSKDIHLQQNIRRDVAEWERNGKSGERLYRGFQLTEAKEWIRRNIPSHVECKFLKASVARQIRTRISIIVAVVLMLVLLMEGVGSLVGFHTLFTRPVLPGGWWSRPVEGQTVHDELHLIAYAYPSTPVSPAIAYVNFTMRWPGNDPWITVCHLTDHTATNIFQCRVNLHKIGAPAGQIGVSFDVYDQRGNVRRAPNGIHHILYIPSFQ